MEVSILGTTYTIEYKARKDDKYLKDCDGYCDKTSHQIVVKEQDSEDELDYYDKYQKKCLRHEIIHAFMFESGLAENFQHAERFGHEETIVDWFAIQFPKILNTFKKAGCINDQGNFLTEETPAKYTTGQLLNNSNSVLEEIKAGQETIIRRQEELIKSAKESGIKKFQMALERMSKEMKTISCK